MPPGPTEMLDISHLTVTLSERQRLQVVGTGRLVATDTVVEDVEWEGDRIQRIAPRFGVVFRDRVRRRLLGTASTSLEAMADVLDSEQSQILSQRDARRRVFLLEGPAGTGKTGVAAPPDRPGLYVVPSATLAAYLKPALRRLGLSHPDTRVATPQDLLAELAPGLLRWVVPEPQSAWPADGIARIRPASVKDPGEFLKAHSDAFRHPAAWLLLAVRASARLVVPPAWVIVDEVQSVPAPALAALGALAAPDAWWVLAGDPLQADRDSFVLADAARLLGRGRGVPQRVHLRQAYRLPPVIHATAAALAARLAPTPPGARACAGTPYRGWCAAGRSRHSPSPRLWRTGWQWPGVRPQSARWPSLCPTRWHRPMSPPWPSAQDVGRGPRAADGGPRVPWGRGAGPARSRARLGV